jgi:hypothetical protein
MLPKVLLESNRLFISGRSELILAFLTSRSSATFSLVMIRNLAPSISVM